MGVSLPHKLLAPLEEPQPGTERDGELDHGALGILRHPGGSGEAVQSLRLLPGFASRTPERQDLDVSVEWAGAAGAAGLWLWPGLLEAWRDPEGSEEETAHPGRAPALDFGRDGPGACLLGGPLDGSGVLGRDHA